MAASPKTDSNIKPVVQWIEKSLECPPWEKVASYTRCTQGLNGRALGYKMDHLWKSPAGDKVIWQLALPKSLHRGVFQLLNRLSTFGHFGVSKTVGRNHANSYHTNWWTLILLRTITTTDLVSYYSMFHTPVLFSTSKFVLWFINNLCM